MVKVFIFYDSKYGNTKLASEKIAEGLKTAAIAVDLGYVKEIHPEVAANYHVIVLGAPNHMASPSRTMKKIVSKLGEFDLKTTQVAIFGTYSGRLRSVDRAVKKLGKMVEEKLPNVKLISPSLSVRVSGVTGPIVEGELPKCVDFGKKIAEHLRS